jgi:hypothetical protein
MPQFIARGGSNSAASTMSIASRIGNGSRRGEVASAYFSIDNRLAGPDPSI